MLVASTTRKVFDMKRILTTSALVLSIALTSVTASSQTASAADGDDIAKLLGAIALFAILNEAQNDRSEKRKATVTDRKPKQKAKRSKVLPRKCLRVLNTKHGQRRIFGKGCLRNNYRHVDRLPQFCATKWRRDGKRLNGYDARCLRNEGYTRA